MISSGCLTYQVWKQKFIRCLINSTKLIQTLTPRTFLAPDSLLLRSGINFCSRWSHFALPHRFLIALISALPDYSLDWCISMSSMCVNPHRYIHNLMSAFTCLNHLRGKPLWFYSVLQSLTSLFQFLPFIMQSSGCGVHTLVPNQYSQDKALFYYLWSVISTQNLHVCLKCYSTHSTLICAVDIYWSYTLIHFLQIFKWPCALSVGQLFTSHRTFTYLPFGKRKDWSLLRTVTRRQIVIKNV